QFRSNADKASGLMEDFRHDFMDFQGKYADAPEAPSVIQQSRSNWLELRKIFCGYYQSGSYTDLEGKEQTCNGRPSQSGSSPETTGDNLTAADLACQSKRPGQYVKIGGKKSMCYYGIDDKMHASR